MRCVLQTWMSVGLVFASLGCVTRGNVEVLEAQLRDQEDRLVALQNDLAKVRGELEVAHRENDSLRRQMTVQGGVLLDEQAAVLSRVEALRFHPLLTSGTDADGRPGDDKLSILLMPVDRDGELLRLAGKVELELFDMSLPADQQRIGQWTFSARQVSEKWQRSLLSAGYHFELDLKEPPHAKELTLHGRLTAGDGRQFDATAQVKVKARPANAGALSARQPGRASATPARFTSPAKDNSGEEPETASAPRRVAHRISSLRAPPSPQVQEADEGEQAATPLITPREKLSRRLPLETSDRFTDRDLPQLR